MPTWSEILSELSKELKKNPSAPDDIRRKYLAKLQQHTKRDTILYATKWTQSGANLPSDYISITDEDIQGIMEVLHGLKGPNLDLIIHSPGGSPEAAEAIVSYIRSKFSNVRVIVPQLAMSAATMIACSADKIVLGKHSFLGPIDPQLVIRTKLGNQMVPAQDILDQFQLAKKECGDPKKLAAWIPMLEQYGPHLLITCKNVLRMSKTVVCDWLFEFMFLSKKTKKRKAEEIANWLGNHTHFKSHGRHIPRETLEKRGLIIEQLESDQTFQDLVLSVFHATTHCFNFTTAAKIIENHEGRAFIKTIQTIAIPTSQRSNP